MKVKSYFYSSLLIISFVFLQGKLSAQNNSKTESLFGDGSVLNTNDLGFFIAPAYGITQMDGSNVSIFNLRGGVNFKDKVSIGGYFNTSINDIKPESENLPNIYMDYWSVGGFAEYTLLAKKLVHLTFPLYMGYGEVQIDNEIGDVGLGEANFFQIEPSALLEINLHKNVRFNLGAGYRIVGQMNYRNFDQSDLSGFTGYAGLKFGLFR
ncbi:MAG: hypothetical protein P8O16_18035 [Algoriphagus sp.]|jgi:hypothetical protein|uniref:hypothetical protein n=1 Tax=Algoriphagus sp. TaxID=1872435 RepID=UPI00263A099D|nr:hypothetical protein [Algoriphagus sp.]MDG1279183.1 hypothetical protein [Algoriphagus sp.]